QAHGGEDAAEEGEQFTPPRDQAADLAADRRVIEHGQRGTGDGERGRQRRLPCRHFLPLILSSAPAATCRTSSSGSFRASVSAGMASFASSPMRPSTLAAFSRTASSLSFSARMRPSTLALSPPTISATASIALVRYCSS